MDRHYLYILYSESSDKYYVGITSDPTRRLNEHNSSPFDTYTSKYRPWELRAVFEAATKKDAASIERFIKKQKSRRLVKKLVDPHFELEGKLAQMIRVPIVRD